MSGGSGVHGSGRRLILFARQPQPGRVKTRLAAVLGEQAACDLYAGMLADVLDLLPLLEGVHPVVFWDREDQPHPPLGPGLEAASQQGRDLGERMADALRRSFADGGQVCCIIGSDAPDLPADYVNQAFQVLEQGGADVVFGPSHDGGYYLVGMRHCWPGLFAGLPWGTSQVLPLSLERAREQGLRVFLLPAWYDIDTVADLERLTGARGAPRTRSALQRISTIAATGG